MVTLEDLLLLSETNVAIMEGAYEVIKIQTYDIHKFLSKELLESEVDHIKVFSGDHIRVWLKEED